MLKEIKRVLRTNGGLLVTTDNQTDIGNALNLIRGKTINQELSISHIYRNSLLERQHIHQYTKSELEHILKDLGFRDVSLYQYNIQHNLRMFTPLKRLFSLIRTIFYLIPMYRPRLFAACRK